MDDDESDNLDNRSIYSADFSLEGDDESNNSDNSSIYSTDIPLEDYESNNSDNSSIYSADISLEGCDLNEDIINDTNRSMDFGKKFLIIYIYIFILYNFYKTNIFF